MRSLLLLQKIGACDGLFAWLFYPLLLVLLALLVLLCSTIKIPLPLGAEKKRLVFGGAGRPDGNCVHAASKAKNSTAWTKSPDSGRYGI